MNAQGRGGKEEGRENGEGAHKEQKNVRIGKQVGEAVQESVLSPRTGDWSGGKLSDLAQSSSSFETDSLLADGASTDSSHASFAISPRSPRVIGVSASQSAPRHHVPSSSTSPILPRSISSGVSSGVPTHAPPQRADSTSPQNAQTLKRKAGISPSSQTQTTSVGRRHHHAISPAQASATTAANGSENSGAISSSPNASPSPSPQGKRITNARRSATPPISSLSSASQTMNNASGTTTLSNPRNDASSRPTSARSAASSGSSPTNSPSFIADDSIEAFEERSRWLSRLQLEHPVIQDVRQRVRPLARTLAFSRVFEVKPEFPAEDILTGAIPPVKRPLAEIVMGLVMQHLHAVGLHKTVASIHQELDRLAARPTDALEEYFFDDAVLDSHLDDTTTLDASVSGSAENTTDSSNSGELSARGDSKNANRENSKNANNASAQSGSTSGNNTSSNTSSTTTLEKTKRSGTSSVSAGEQDKNNDSKKDEMEKAEGTQGSNGNESNNAASKDATTVNTGRSGGSGGGANTKSPFADLAEHFANTTFRKDQAFFERDLRESPLVTMVRSAMVRAQEVYDLAMADHPSASALSESSLEEKLYALGMLEDDDDMDDDVDIWDEEPDPEEDLNASHLVSASGSAAIGSPPGSISSRPGSGRQYSGAVPTSTGGGPAGPTSPSTPNSANILLGTPMTSHSAGASTTAPIAASMPSYSPSASGSMTERNDRTSERSSLLSPTASTPSHSSQNASSGINNTSSSSFSSQNNTSNAHSSHSSSSSTKRPSSPLKPSSSGSSKPESSKTSISGRRSSHGNASKNSKIQLPSTPSTPVITSSPSNQSTNANNNGTGLSSNNGAGGQTSSEVIQIIQTPTNATNSSTNASNASSVAPPSSASQPPSHSAGRLSGSGTVPSPGAAPVGDSIRGRKLLYDYWVDVEEGEERPIRAATLNKLVEIATSAKLANLNFTPAFLMTYKSFTTPKKLFEKLKQRWAVPQRAAEEQLGLSYEQYATPIRLRWIAFLKKWLTDYPEDIDRSLLADMRRFTEIIAEDEPAMRALSNSIIVTLDKISAHMALQQAAASSSAYQTVSVVGGHNFSFQQNLGGPGMSPYAYASALVFSERSQYSLSSSGSGNLYFSPSGSLGGDASNSSVSSGLLLPSGSSSCASMGSSGGVNSNSLGAGSVSLGGGSVSGLGGVGSSGAFSVSSSNFSSTFASSSNASNASSSAFAFAAASQTQVSGNTLISIHGPSGTSLSPFTAHIHQHGQNARKVSIPPGAPPAPKVPKTIFHPTLSIYQVDQEEVARQLTLMDSHVFMAIKPSELLNQSWNKPKLKFLAPNVLRMVAMFNQISHSISAHILQGPKPKDRAKIIEWWIRVAEHCKTLSNYHGVMAVVSGINSGPTVRLKYSRREVSKSLMDQLASYEKIFESDGSFSIYRATLSASIPPVIPYLGIHLTDLTFIEEGNKDMHAHLINFAKRRLLYATISSLQNYQQTGYNLQPVRQVQDLIANLKPGDVKELFKISLMREPRDNRG